jgi:hypothetical protein
MKIWQPIAYPQNNYKCISPIRGVDFDAANKFVDSAFKLVDFRNKLADSAKWIGWISQPFDQWQHQSLDWLNTPIYVLGIMMHINIQITKSEVFWRSAVINRSASKRRLLNEMQLQFYRGDISTVVLHWRCVVECARRNAWRQTRTLLT